MFLVILDSVAKCIVVQLLQSQWLRNLMPILTLCHTVAGFITVDTVILAKLTALWFIYYFMLRSCV